MGGAPPMGKLARGLKENRREEKRGGKERETATAGARAPQKAEPHGGEPGSAASPGSCLRDHSERWEKGQRERKNGGTLA